MSDPIKPRASSPDVLPDDLSWAAGGHASDIVLTALADGQVDIVPVKVREHVEHCTVCTTHLGHAALLSLHVGDELAAGRREPVAARRPLPWPAIISGLAVAVLGAIPSLLDAPSLNRTLLARELSVLLRDGSALFRWVAPDSAASLPFLYGATILLVAIGLGVAKTVSKSQKEASR